MYISHFIKLVANWVVFSWLKYDMMSRDTRGHMHLSTTMELPYIMEGVQCTNSQSCQIHFNQASQVKRLDHAF